MARMTMLIFIALLFGTLSLLGAAAAFASPGDTVRIPATEGGAQLDGYAWAPSVSDDGRRVAFKFIEAVEPVFGVGAWVELAIYDRATGETTWIDEAAGGLDGEPGDPLLSGNGRILAFTSALPLTDQDANEVEDVFLYDLGTAEITRLSFGSTGGDADGPSWAGDISHDGRYVAFTSEAANLVSGDTDHAPDVYLHDTHTRTTRLVSVGGDSLDGWSGQPSISNDGRHVAFSSVASDLVPRDTNEATDVFLRDMTGDAMTLVSVGSGGELSNGDSWDVSLSGDGGAVTFTSLATNLVNDDHNRSSDVFLRDLRLGQTRRISRDFLGGAPDAESLASAIAADGEHVGFHSPAANLVLDDTNGVEDVFVHHVPSGRITRVSIDSQGRQANSYSSNPAISADGRFIVFESWATNLAPGSPPDTQSIFLRELAIGWYVDDDGSVFEADIDAIAAAGITRGCNPPINDHYCPDQPVTRGQMAAFLVRAIGLPAAPPQALADTTGSVFASDIDALFAAGITRGCNPPTNDHYCPDQPVTRGQMAAFLVRAFLP